MTVGVVAIQGDFEKHIEALHSVGGVDVVEVRSREDLAKADRLIIPGGESTTVGLLMARFGLGDALQQRAAEGMPMWGTCMGMILMCENVENRSDQYTLGLLDIDVRRNAFGAQVHSFEDAVPLHGLDEPVCGVFIRAPVVTRLGEGVAELGRYEGQVVAVRQGNLLGTSFHPELTDDRRLHRYFLSL
ncbi:pyridoxal 5'-phosphate synthase glutaminase subunit PdxT [Fimbriimonas ginsengisoli]|uniref:Pyridoxal 5'-phosphate synthase subunit PdxT n=1 Tax=Fimbriimonas ginsengisoli Gsoil 348 TaxID=661478 RepID=A0A068NSP5_FIMGI|nr:pyridoxal 5'-phosphate synthase glutaminase subunit PdxT [Fimbriimonas ginsengisoli]AIE85800.1 SNO glutamine amidotransferase [Fimbriimonas ginsengisoli Gsoil 348]